MPKTRKKYEQSRRALSEAAKKMLDAELELGHLVAELGLENADAIARDIGVRKSIVVAAALAARGLVRRHRPLERQMAAKKKRAA